MPMRLANWDHAHLLRKVNDTFTAAAIPLRVCLSRSGDGGINWHVDAHGGTVSAALERIEGLQDKISRQFDRYGLRAISRNQAFFMYASQWFIWVVLHAGEAEPEHDELTELMERWLAVYDALWTVLVN